MRTLPRQVFRFGPEAIDGNGTMVSVLGGKGAGLAEMTSLALPVPPGFTVTTDVCHAYLLNGVLSSEFVADLDDSMSWLERQTKKCFGGQRNPLLVSVRSGAPISMPGMMDTVLNVGLNDQTVIALEAISGSKHFALDSYRRLLQMFGSVVLDVPKEAFAWLPTQRPAPETIDQLPSTTELCLTIEKYKNVILAHAGKPFPQDPIDQMHLAIEAVFRSWHSDRARFYRTLNRIPDDMGTAVTVQAMVFGNQGPTSGTGVGFTRNPSTGERALFAEYLSNAQGEDIVAGTRTPMSIDSLAAQMPAVYEELQSLTQGLEQHYKDTQDFEFTIENGKLFLLQTRTAKRSALASVRIAVEMAREGLITRAEAVKRVKPSDINEMLCPQLDLCAVTGDPLTRGLPASPGSAVGVIALSADTAVAMRGNNRDVILLTKETTAEDIHGMAASVGFLTARGGATSHAAVVARGMGKCCITGAKEIDTNPAAGTVRIGSKTFKEGDWISLDGSTGRVFEGRLPVKPASENHPELDQLSEWALSLDACKVRANADTPDDAASAIKCGAIGIGLCRTEHMFFASDRLDVVRAMILATSATERVHALERLLPIQQSDFEALFRTMSPMPVTVRLLDPPLHEFLPSTEDINRDILLARSDENWERSLSLEEMRKRVEALTESNPMMGHRGCRLSLTYPEILEMQVTAILRAAQNVRAEGFSPQPEIMVPLVASEEEMAALAALIHATARKILGEDQGAVKYKVGTMIELPRAAVCAGPIAKHVSFISFGTNDLTQMTYGFSRDDARSYLDCYLEQGIFKVDPFVTIDEEGVGKLMEMAIKSARATNPTVKIGVCGEHGGDPDSIQYFCSLGIDYVSCSPSRLRIAQLAAAQAALKSAECQSGQIG